MASEGVPSARRRRTERSVAVMPVRGRRRPGGDRGVVVELAEHPGGVPRGQQGLTPGHRLRRVVQLGGAGVRVEAAPGADPDGLVAVGGLVGAGHDEHPAHGGPVGHFAAELERVDGPGLDRDDDDVGDVGQDGPEHLGPVGGLDHAEIELVERGALHDRHHQWYRSSGPPTSMGRSTQPWRRVVDQFSAMASRMFSLEARRAGRMAAATPARAAITHDDHELAERDDERLQALVLEGLHDGPAEEEADGEAEQRAEAAR